jgi:hypothetical protein
MNPGPVSSAYSEGGEMVSSEQAIIMKLHSVQGQNILAICDKELLGRTFEWGDVGFLVSRGFYGGEEVPTDLMIRTALQCTSINAIGSACIHALVEAGIVDREAIVYINDVPHCQVYCI